MSHLERLLDEVSTEMLSRELARRLTDEECDRDARAALKRIDRARDERFGRRAR